jgi:hypothetical protein
VKTDRLNQLLVTVCVFVVMAMQFNYSTQRQDCKDCGVNCQCPDCDCDSGYTVESQPLDASNPALTEPKYGVFGRWFRRPVAQSQCVDGNCRAVPMRVQPQSQTQPPKNPNCPDGNCPLVKNPSIEKPRTGMVRCSCCNAVIVGEQLHTEWTDKGEPLSPCCEKCWQKMSHEQRQSSVEKWARSAGLDEQTIARYRGAIQ